MYSSPFEQKSHHDSQSVNRWWPDAAWDDLYLVSLFTVWAFIWDDTIDTNEHALSDDFGQACAFRNRSIIYVKHCLGLFDADSEPSPCPDSASFLFKEFADIYRQKVGKCMHMGAQKLACRSKANIRVSATAAIL